MRARKEIEKKIEREQQRVKALQREIEMVQAFVAGLQEALKLLPKESAGAQPARDALRSGSELDKVREAISSTGKPLYIDDILTALGKEVTAKHRAGLAGSLGNYVRRGMVFQRTGPNTFGLIDPCTENGNNSDALDTSALPQHESSATE